MTQAELKILENMTVLDFTHDIDQNMDDLSMDDNCGEWVEFMGSVTRRWVWLECIGVVSGYYCKEVYRFRHL